ncbi:uncharacterized protein ColSpa_03623 [Colletotrichum spaethianum]|uniref:Uncharacterized protein n=1 Tax=Colletotrichum spaethianum TaxID=700344 RepID=A0AA37L7X3_9PEZI|nr:uncharacterized protein ColSpa_03623 [Colletotrichum spaethianum]GKT43442.1 hypothetical protein ColSpa_03623 [Colletotrichum spaethianum]
MENQHGAYGSFGSANDKDLVNKVNAFNESKIEHGSEGTSSAENKATQPILGTSDGGSGDVQETGRKVTEKVGDMLNKNK